MGEFSYPPSKGKIKGRGVRCAVCSIFFSSEIGKGMSKRSKSKDPNQLLQEMQATLSSMSIEEALASLKVQGSVNLSRLGLMFYVLMLSATGSPKRNGKAARNTTPSCFGA